MKSREALQWVPKNVLTYQNTFLLTLLLFLAGCSGSDLSAESTSQEILPSTPLATPDLSEEPTSLQAPTAVSAESIQLDYPDLIPLEMEHFFMLSEDRRRLQFPTGFANIGGELRLEAGGVRSDGKIVVNQVIRGVVQGTDQPIEVHSEAGASAFHTIHKHMHNDNFVQVSITVPHVLESVEVPDNLDISDPSTEVLSPDGKTITIPKQSFCLQDGNPTDPVHYYSDAYNQVAEVNAIPTEPVFRECGYTQGLSTGWYDYYGSQTPGQEVIFDPPLPPGATVIVTYVLDPINVIAEANEANNSLTIVVTFP